MQADPFTSEMPQAFRPRTVMEVVDATFRIYRENFVSFVTISALVTVPVAIIVLLQNLSAPNLNAAASSLGRAELNFPSGQVFPLIAAAFVFSIVQLTLLNGVFSKMVSERFFGRVLKVGDAWAAASPRLVTLGVSYIYLYIVLGIAMVAVLFIGVLCFPLFSIFGVIGYIAITSGSMLAPVVMLENSSGGAAFTRAYMLAKSRFWQLIGLVVALGVISFIVSIAASFCLLPLLLLSPDGFFSPQGLFSPQGQIINAVISGLTSILTAPIIPIGMALLYHDARVRAEGLDISLQTPGSDAQLNSAPISNERQPLFDSKDFMNLLILAGIALLAGIVMSSLLTNFSAILSNFGR